MNRAAYKIGLAIAWAVEHAPDVSAGVSERSVGPEPTVTLSVLRGEQYAATHVVLTEVEAGNVNPTDVLADLVSSARAR